MQQLAEKNDLAEESSRKRILGQVAYEIEKLVLDKVLPDHLDRAVYSIKQFTERAREYAEVNNAEVNNAEVNNAEFNNAVEIWQALKGKIKWNEAKHNAVLGKLKDLRLEEAHPPLPSVDDLRKMANLEFPKGLAPILEIINIYETLRGLP